MHLAEAMANVSFQAIFYLFGQVMIEFEYSFLFSCPLLRVPDASVNRDMDREIVPIYFQDAQCSIPGRKESQPPV